MTNDEQKPRETSGTEEKTSIWRFKRSRKPSPTWEEISERVYERIEWYATRFLLTSIVGMVLGFIAFIYALLSILFLGRALQDLSVFLGVFAGAGAMVASLILLGWGMFWREKVDKRSIFK